MNARAAAPSNTDVPIARCGVATTVGHRRRRNEDAAVAGPVWYAVADGMGGHRAGDVASAAAVEAIAAAPRPVTISDVHAAVRRADRAVRARAARDGTVGMGTTIVGAVAVGVAPDAIAVFHVGDSRCYRALDGRFEQLTADHSQVRELVDAGLVSPEDARRHPLRNVVTRTLGFGDSSSADIVVLDRPGRLLLCSDGVSGELEPSVLARELAANTEPQRTADRLIELALDGDARDNATALVVDFRVGR